MHQDDTKEAKSVQEQTRNDFQSHDQLSLGGISHFVYFTLYAFGLCLSFISDTFLVSSCLCHSNQIFTLSIVTRCSNFLL